VTFSDRRVAVSSSKSSRKASTLSWSPFPLPPELGSSPLSKTHVAPETNCFSVFVTPSRNRTLGSGEGQETEEG
jgi:hypothetical protein